jgi:hypothetical protein
MVASSPLSSPLAHAARAPDGTVIGASISRPPSISTAATGDFTVTFDAWDNPETILGDFVSNPPRYFVRLKNPVLTLILHPDNTNEIIFYYTEVSTYNWHSISQGGSPVGIPYDFSFSAANNIVLHHESFIWNVTTQCHIRDKLFPFNFAGFPNSQDIRNITGANITLNTSWWQHNGDNACQPGDNP